MNELIDKLFLFACSFFLYLFVMDSPYAVVPVLIIVVLSCLCTYFEKPGIQSLLYAAYLAVSFVYPVFLIFLPFMMYDLLFSSFQFLLFGSFLIVGLGFDTYHPMMLALMFLFCSLCYILKYKSRQFKKLMKEYHKTQDAAVELSLVQEEKNRSILENQDYEINVATLNERNRISKEIHDHVGHLLSRSLLQIGALLTITKEPVIKKSLTDLKNSLSEGMDSIRASIHNMHDESIDLYGTIEGLIKDFSFCPVTFEYDIYNPPLLKLKYCMIAIIKESLSNIAKHSNGSRASIILKEQPGLYQLIIYDNGTVEERTKAILRRCRIQGEYTEGMGLQSISDRVKGFQGNINITADDGFKLFITIPKDSRESI